MTNTPKRTSSTQLPTANELFEILLQESQRLALRFDFVDKNMDVFAAHRELSKKANSDDSWIDTYKEIPLDELDAKIRQNHSALTAYIKTHPEDSALYAALYKALEVPDNTSKSDAIFVFGAPSDARIERAVELYNEGVAPKIIVSGSGPHYVDVEQSEARRMANYAIERGVQGDDIMLETRSITLPDNVKRTIEMLETLNWEPRSLTIIATNLFQTRAVMEWYKFAPWDITIKPVAARPLSSKFTAEGWTDYSDVIALVLNEYAKMIFETKIDLLKNEKDTA